MSNINDRQFSSSLPKSHPDYVKHYPVPKEATSPSGDGRTVNFPNGRSVRTWKMDGVDHHHVYTHDNKQVMATPHRKDAINEARKES